jgi:hypothetical protein
MQTFDTERFSLKKLIEVDSKEHRCVEILRRLRKTSVMMWTLIGLGKVLERALRLARESLGYYELKQHKSWHLCDGGT